MWAAVPHDEHLPVISVPGDVSTEALASRADILDLVGFEVRDIVTLDEFMADLDHE